ncbi:sigma-70 family RNA polymerase sigma factor [Lignipirellula cremea]|uniref:RNA polymerase sigma factor CnrH n=1 Tax=Lignipirellula cremea TaxID=2528010 RepID=A0A518DXL7_9BACT|nr:sigma-70 family RNA polymerase sigma factor [Lignipirellula cremea]QDU96572.1 RNA polymerase sigma factor CnrH [Lignipirellula cremea]
MTTNNPPQPTIEALFLQQAAAVRGFVRGLVPDRAAADDVFQEVFLTVKQRGADFRRDGDFLAWVRGIARNKVLEHYRRQRRTPLPFDEELLNLLADSAEGSDQLLEQRREALTKCLERLAPRAREIVDLRYAEQPLSPPEIAERLAWTTNAVHVALARARAFLRECTQQVLASGEVS